MKLNENILKIENYFFDYEDKSANLTGLNFFITSKPIEEEWKIVPHFISRDQMNMSGVDIYTKENDKWNFHTYLKNIDDEDEYFSSTWVGSIGHRYITQESKNTESSRVCESLFMKAEILFKDFIYDTDHDQRKDCLDRLMKTLSNTLIEKTCNIQYKSRIPQTFSVKDIINCDIFAVREILRGTTFCQAIEADTIISKFKK